MAVVDNYKRRCGNTTRQVDDWIQQLFNGEEVQINDHAQRDGNFANKSAERVFLRRLEFEHGLKVGRSSQLQFHNDTQTYKLFPF